MSRLRKEGRKLPTDSFSYWGVHGRPIWVSGGLGRRAGHLWIHLIAEQDTSNITFLLMYIF